VRKALAVRTTFNFLGPLTNPAGARRQLIGVSDPSKLELIAGALAELGCERALVVSSEDGLDEISASGQTTVLDVSPGGISAATVSPADFGLEPVPLEALAGGSPEANAETTRRVLAGEQGPARAFVVVNAGAALVAAGLADTLADGARLAEQAIDSGAAEAALERFVAVSRGVTESRPA
jgi:anthranilate phosphoribosyltransferase